MASDFLLELDGVKGESKDKAKADTIEVQSFSFGVSNSGTAAAGTGAGTGKAALSDFSFTSAVNKSSPELFLSCTNGKHFKKAVLTCRKQGEEQHIYLTYTMSDLIITSHSIGGGGDSVHESFSFNFSKIEMEYKPQKADGTLDTAVKTGWDLKANVKV